MSDLTPEDITSGGIGSSALRGTMEASNTIGSGLSKGGNLIGKGGNLIGNGLSDAGHWLYNND